MLRDQIPTAVTLAGVFCFTTGLRLIFPPAAWLFVGLVAMVSGIAWARRNARG